MRSTLVKIAVGGYNVSSQAQGGAAVGAYLHFQRVVRLFSSQCCRAIHARARMLHVSRECT